MTKTFLCLHVRPGFEDDSSQELKHHLLRLGVTNEEIDFAENSGFVSCGIDSSQVAKVRADLKWNELIFARQLLWSSGSITLPKDGDRIADLISALNGPLLALSGGNAYSGFFFETPDADDAKELSGFCKSLSRPLENALNKHKLLPKGKGAAHLARLHLVMTNPTTVWPAFADVANASPWSMGIPRLKFPAGAPSRSTLKLEEAFLVLLGQQQMTTRLKEGMTAVDLGACPGGWTYQLVKRGIHVIAIDNGSMDPSLMETGLVEHVRDDAFRYRPSLPVDWLVCDVVEQPSRIAELMMHWLTSKWCHDAIFNLKLPMKKRWEETRDCLDLIAEGCKKAGRTVQIHCKQLYHDRKEVTVYITLT